MASMGSKHWELFSSPSSVLFSTSLSPGSPDWPFSWLSNWHLILTTQYPVRRPAHHKGIWTGSCNRRQGRPCEQPCFFSYQLLLISESLFPFCPYFLSFLLTELWMPVPAVSSASPLRRLMGFVNVTWPKQSPWKTPPTLSFPTLTYLSPVFSSSGGDGTIRPAAQARNPFIAQYSAPVLTSNPIASTVFTPRAHPITTLPTFTALSGPSASSSALQYRRHLPPNWSPSF